VCTSFAAYRDKKVVGVFVFFVRFSRGTGSSQTPNKTEKLVLLGD
jgi:hypothetical protein